ncbi:MAG: DUF899 family protein, partial [Phycisphaerae bacterium]
GCVGCSMVTDQFGCLAHLNARNTSFCLVSLAPLTNIEKLKKRMGWRLDNVHDVDADERSLLVQFRCGLPTYVVGHDGGHDDAIRCAHVS